MPDIFQGADPLIVQARRKEYICDTSLKDFYFIAARTMREDEIFVRDPIVAEALFAPLESPDRLPEGKLAVVMWVWGGVCLLVDRVDHIRKHRYGDWHYDPKNSRCNLASQIEREMPKAVQGKKVGDWMKEKIDRFNFILPEKYGRDTASYLQAFLTFRFFPHFRA